MTNTSISMKTRIPANIYSVLRDVESRIAMRNQIDASMFVPMDSNFIGKVMLKSMANIDVSEHAHAMTRSSISMKNIITARTSSVLRVVDWATALENQIDALIHFVHTD